MSKVIVRTAAVRMVRKLVVAGVAAGTHTLRVIGTQATGFRLAGEKPTRVVQTVAGVKTETVLPVVTAFGKTFKTQTAAVAHGESKFNKTAKKMLLKQPAAAVA